MLGHLGRCWGYQTCQGIFWVGGEMACDVQKEAAFARGTAGNVFTNNLAIVTSAIQICNLCVSACNSERLCTI